MWASESAHCRKLDCIHPHTYPVPERTIANFVQRASEKSSSRKLRRHKKTGAELDPGPFRCLVSLLHPAKLPLGRLLYLARLLYGRHACPRGDHRGDFLGIEVDRAFSPLRRREQQIRRSADSRVPDNLPYHLIDGRASVVSVFVCNYLPCLGTHLQHLKVDWLFAVVGVDLYPHHGGPLAFVGFSASYRKG